MGICLKQSKSGKNSKASTIKDLTKLIMHLTQKLDIKSRELEMYHHCLCENNPKAMGSEIWDLGNVGTVNQI